jgi:hypothetical protein
LISRVLRELPQAITPEPHEHSSRYRANYKSNHDEPPRGRFSPFGIAR